MAPLPSHLFLASTVWARNEGVGGRVDREWSKARLRRPYFGNSPSLLVFLISHLRDTFLARRARVGTSSTTTKYLPTTASSSSTNAIWFRTGSRSSLLTVNSTHTAYLSSASVTLSVSCRNAFRMFSTSVLRFEPIRQNCRLSSLSDAKKKCEA